MMLTLCGSQRERSDHGHQQCVHHLDPGHTKARSESPLYFDCPGGRRVSKYVPKFPPRTGSPASANLAMTVDTILVISHEKLSIDLSRLFPHLTVLRLPKSGGAVDLDEHYNSLIQAFQIRSYFYGEPKLPAELAPPSLQGKQVGLAGQLTPYSFQIGWETLTVVRVGEGQSRVS